MDDACESVAQEVNDALRYPFNFHKVNKIVLCLGKSEIAAPDYIEQLGVGTKQCLDFDLDGYSNLSRQERVFAIRSVVLDTFSWLEGNFADAQFVSVARKNLYWVSSIGP